MADKIFAEGIYFDRNEKAPEWVIGRLGINRDKAIAWLLEQPVSDRGYLNLNIARSKNGKAYVELDTWKPSGDRPVADRGRQEQTPFDDDVPW